MGALVIIVDEQIEALGARIKDIIGAGKQCFIGRIRSGITPYEIRNAQEIDFSSLDAVLVPSHLDDAWNLGISATVGDLCSAPIIGYGPLPPKNWHYAFFLNTQRLMDPDDEHRQQFLAYLEKTRKSDP